MLHSLVSAPCFIFFTFQVVALSLSSFGALLFTSPLSADSPPAHCFSSLTSQLCALCPHLIALSALSLSALIRLSRLRGLLHLPYLSAHCFTPLTLLNLSAWFDLVYLARFTSLTSLTSLPLPLTSLPFPRSLLHLPHSQRMCITSPVSLLHPQLSATPSFDSALSALLHLSPLTALFLS